MPYLNEYAGYSSLRRIADSKTVQSLLMRARIRDQVEWERTNSSILDLDAGIKPSGWLPDYVFAIDGSHLEQHVETGYPGAEVSYITVAAILLDIAKLRNLDVCRPSDPCEFRKTETTATIDRALPGCNVIIDNEPSASASFRRCLYEVFRDTQMDPEGESLLDTYQHLLKYKPADDRQRCPYYQECGEPHHYFVRQEGEYTTPCSRARPLYSTDALRIHEGMAPGGTNGAMFAEVMQVLERTLAVHLLRMLEQNNWLSTLARIAVVLDGPLAVFGHPAWLAPAIRFELMRLNNLVKRATQGKDILLLGVEKSGEFVEHLAELDKAPGCRDGLAVRAGRLPNKSAFLLTDDYIKRHIILQTGGKPYGKDTYFGRKLFYKTAANGLVVATLPMLADDHGDLSTARSDQFPRLTDAMALLDAMVSSQYANALVPLVRAHAEAAIPLRLGDKVLEELVRKLMPQEGA